MNLTIHRGSKNIGGSCVELRSSNGGRILLDAGMPLTQKDGSAWPRGTMTRPAEELRRENVLPNIDGLYAGESPKFSALILSHAHLDHYGLAHYVHPDVPVYGSRGTIAMMQASKMFIRDAAIPKDPHELPNIGKVNLPSFSVQGIPVDHAAPDSRALLVEADGQRLLYSGDLRAHGRHPEMFNDLPNAAGPIDVLILEGTTVGQPQGAHGFADEVDVEQSLTKILTDDKGLVVVIASGQNIDRAVSVYNSACATGREMVIDSYQAYVLMKLRDICPEAPQFDSPSVRVKFVGNHVKRLIEEGLYGVACKMARASKVSAEQLAANPRGFVYLARSSPATVNLLTHLKQTPYPTILWSQWKGYLEKSGPIQNFCVKHGITPSVIHSGGHARPEDLAELARRIQPRAVIPIHTEAAAQFENFIPNVRVVNDGEALDLNVL